jgi:hypothetical protein
MKWFMTFLTAILIVIHQDFWNWSKADPRMFGFLPVGIWYQGFYCVAASILLAMWVAFLWPRHLENVQPEPGVVRDDSMGGH